MRQVSKTQLFWLLVMGALGYFFSYLFMGISQKHISTSLAGILASLNPLFVFIIGIAFFKHEIKWKNIWGISIGLIGCLLIVLFKKSNGQSTEEYYYIFVMLGSVLSSSIALNLSQAHLRGLPAIVISSVSFGSAAILALLGLLVVTDWKELFQNPQIVTCTASLLCLSIIGTAIASLVYFHIMKVTSALYTSTVTYIIPIVAILWGLTMNEQITWNQIAGLGLIIAGIRLIR